MSMESLSDTVELLNVKDSSLYYDANPDQANTLTSIELSPINGTTNTSQSRESTATGNTEALCGPKVYTFIAASLAAMGGILFGYDVGIISGALLQLETVFCLSCLQKELVVSFMLIGAIIGSLTGGFLIDFYGRRFTIIVNSVIFIAGALTLALSPSYSVLIFGRLLVGYGVAISAIAECVYVSEIAPARKRGLLVSLNELGITLGFLFAYLVSYFFIGIPNGWRYMFGLSAIPAAIQGFGMFFLPSSPRYLMIKKKDVQAFEVLTKLRGGNQNSVQSELAAIRISLISEQDRKFCDLFSSKDNMRGRLVIGAGLVFFQQFTGQPNVLYYAPTIFESIGFESNTGATLASVGLGVVKVLCTIVTVMLVDKIGRRKLLLVGASLMAASILTLGIVNSGMFHVHKPCVDNFCDLHTATYTITTPTSTSIPSEATTPKMKLNITSSFLSNSSTTFSITEATMLSTTNQTSKKAKPHMSGVAKWLSLASLMVFVAAFAIGFGPVTWLILSEIYPSSIKGRAVSLSTVLNWGTNLLVSLTFLDVVGSIGISWTFITYSLICILSIVFIFTIVPETKNKTLEEISLDLKTRSPLQHVVTHCQSLPCCNPNSAFRLRMTGFYEHVTVA